MTRLPRLLLERRVPILIGIGLLTLFLAYFSSRIRMDQNPEELIYSDDPEYPRLQSFYSWFGYDEIIVAALSTKNTLAEDNIRRIQAITEDLQRIQGVERVISLANAQDVVSRDGLIEIVPLLQRMPRTKADQERLRRSVEQNPFFKKLLISSDGKSTLFDITISSKVNNKERSAILSEINQTFTTHSDGNRHYLTGAPYGRTEFIRCLFRDFTTLFPLAMLLLILAMFVLFRHFLFVLLPFVTISLAVVWTLGFMYLLGSKINFLSVLTPTILFIIGTSDCVHVLSQYQDCRYMTGAQEEAIRETIRLMVSPCFLTSLTTAMGLFSLWFCPILALRLFGFFTGVGIGFAFLLSITLIPVGLSSAGNRFRTPGRPPSKAMMGALEKLYKFDRSQPLLIVLFALFFLLLGIYGTTRLQVETDLTNYFGKKFKGVTDTLFIAKELGAVLPLYVVIDSQEEDGLKDPRLLAKVHELSEYIRGVNGVDKVVSISDLVQYANYRLHDNERSFYRIPQDRKEVAEILLMISLSDGTDLLSRFLDDQNRKAIVTIRFGYYDFYRIQEFNRVIRTYLQEHLQSPAGLEAYTTGTAILVANTLVPILKGLKESLLVAIVTILLLMILVSRSLKLGLISMIPTLIPIAMTLGLMGLLHISLNFATAPMAAIALGLAIDDTIHFLSRFRIEFRKEPNYAGAIQKTLQSVGKPIMITSIILVCGFSIFLFSNFHLTRNMGVLISFSVVSAIMGDLILLPVLLYMFKPLGKETPPPPSGDDVHS